MIATRNRPAKLEECLDAVARLDYPRFDVLVVDNAPVDGQAKEIASRRGVRYIVEPLRGSSRARNRGARSCNTDIIAYLDDDAIPEPGWLSALVAEFSDPLVMAVTARVAPVRLESETEKMFQQAGGFNPGEIRRVVDSGTAFWFEMAAFGGLGNEAGMAIRRKAFDFWAGFDERLGVGNGLFAGGDGGHAFFSFIESGYRVVYTPRAMVKHPIPHNREELRVFYIRLLGSAVAYMALLFIEHPRHRGSILRYTLHGLFGTRRYWRNTAKKSISRIVPRWYKLLIVMRALVRFTRWYLAQKYFA